jgi:hypothetical protein
LVYPFSSYKQTNRHINPQFQLHMFISASFSFKG